MKCNFTKSLSFPIQYLKKISKTNNHSWLDSRMKKRGNCNTLHLCLPDCSEEKRKSSQCRASFIIKLIGDILEPDLNLHKFRSGCKLSPEINTLYILYTCDQFRSGSNMSPIIISWQSAPHYANFGNIWGFFLQKLSSGSETLGMAS